MIRSLLVRATVCWLGILVLASLNGAVRDLLLTPRLGDTVARALSTLLLSALVLLAAWLMIRWIGPSTARQATSVGGLWLALTLTFELLVGHYGFRKPWADLLADYDLSRGRIWIVALIVTFVAPWWAAKTRGLWAPGWAGSSTR